MHIRSEIYVSITLPITCNMLFLIDFLANDCGLERAIVCSLQIINGITILFHGIESFSRSYPFSASQIPHILWNPKFHYVIYKSTSNVPTLSQINPVYGPSRNILIIHLNTIVPSTPMSSIWFLSIMFPQ